MSISHTHEQSRVAMMIDRMLDWLETTRQCRQAQSLDDRLLADIGTSRGELPARLTEAKSS